MYTKGIAVMSATANDPISAGLGESLSGSILLPDAEGYDRARAIYNGLIDRRPALIVRCRTTGDVAAALAVARREGLDVSIRGGGHNVAGRSVTDGGVMIDLAEMKEIAIDPERMTATAQGGVIWAELNDAAGADGLAVTGGTVSATGIAGYTLGGGLGLLMAKYGLASDNLLAVELVTATGDVLTVDADSHPDLFWALRGGGGRLGRPQRVCGPRPRPRRLRREACGVGRLPYRRRRHGGARPRAVQGLGVAVGGSGRGDAVPGDEHDPRPGVPGRVAQLLAVELHPRPPRWADRRRRHAVRGCAFTDERDPLRALPRRGDARGGNRNGSATPRGGLEPAPPHCL